MSKIIALFRSRETFSVSLSFVCTVLFSLTVVHAATTISTNVNTGGTLTVTGIGHLQADLNIYGNDLNIGTGTATSTLSGGFGIGVGTTTPGAVFAIATSTAGLNTAFLLSNLGSNYTFYAEDTANDSSPFVIDATGNVGLGTTTPGVKLGVAGDINANIIYGDTFFATSTTATSTFRGGLIVDTSTLVVDFSTNRIGIGTTSPWALFSVNPDQVSGAEFAVGSSTKTDLIVTNAGRVGVGSTTPFVALGITGTTTSSAGAIVGIDGSPVNQIRFGTCTYNPGAVVTTSGLSTNCTGATGVTPTDRVFVTPQQLELGLIFTAASSTAADVIQVTVLNATTTGGITPASRSWFWMAIK